jgi:hypothetical protein
MEEIWNTFYPRLSIEELSRVSGGRIIHVSCYGGTPEVEIWFRTPGELVEITNISVPCQPKDVQHRMKLIKLVRHVADSLCRNSKL